MSSKRTRLEKRRMNKTFEGAVGTHKITLTAGERPDGSLGEIFIDMHKTGSAFHSLMNCFAILVSLCLQHGVPLSLLVKRFTGVNFEPNGYSDYPGVEKVTSLVDFVFQVLKNEYLAKETQEAAE